MLALFMILGGALLRLAPHLPNFAPVSATALFGGAKLKTRYALLVPLACILISDYLLLYIHPFAQPAVNFSHLQPLSALFYPAVWYVWGSFAISGLIGLWLRRHYRASNIVLAALAVSLQFYLITNFGVWAAGMYGRDLAGLATSYLMGLPFLKWTMLGDLFYTGAFFGAYELARRAALAQTRATATDEAAAATTEP